MKQVPLISEELSDYLFENLPYEDKYGKFPEIQGNNLSQHWRKIAEKIGGDWEKEIEELFNIPKLPSYNFEVELNTHWTKYKEGEPPKRIAYPNEKVLVFDVEVAVTEGNYPTMAVAMGKEAFYVWLSPQLFGGSGINLIPFGDRTENNLILIGHNIVGYDRARVKEEYQLGHSGIYFLDTLSMHVATAGLSTKQRLSYLKFQKDQAEGGADYSDEWMHVGAMNNLKEVAKLHLGIELDKSIRDLFVSGTIQEIINNLQDLIQYNLTDVLVTAKLAKVLWAKFKQKSPHPVTRTALLLMSKMYLPTTRERWYNYVNSAETEYQNQTKAIEQSLVKLADLALEQYEKDPESVLNDQWLGNLNWNFPSKRTKILPDKPEWYRSLRNPKTGKIKITTKTQITPYLLKLKWDGYPLKYFRELGWGYIVPKDDLYETNTVGYVLDDDFNLIPLSLDNDSEYLYLVNTMKGATAGKHWLFYKIPHKDGEKANCGCVLSKEYLKDIESGMLSSEYEEGGKAVNSAVACSYWVSIKKRIHSQFLICPHELNIRISPLVQGREPVPNPDAVIIPSLIPIGTVSRRATENTWLTASNPKKNKIGSELKTTILAPEGYKIVGGDVSSQEAWIASLLGDSYTQGLLPPQGKAGVDYLLNGYNWEVKGKVGKTPFSVQVLIGEKSNNTDIHSFTTQVVLNYSQKLLGKPANVNRDNCKQLNYSRYYGAGVRSTGVYLRQFDKQLSTSEANKIAKQIFAETKGEKIYNPHTKTKVWAGGSESEMFNALDEISNSPLPATPCLMSCLSDALLPMNDKRNQYATSRTNWVVQSSGVDFLHLMLVGTEYLFRLFKIEGRLALTIHDSLHYIVKEEQAEMASWLLNICHLWVRAFFSYRVGIKEIPKSIAWFDGIDIDHTLRKEVTSPCLTPSKKDPEPEGRVFFMV